MKLNTFAIFSVLTAATLVAGFGAEAQIRPGKVAVIKSQRAKIAEKLAKLKYKPGSYVVRAIELRKNEGAKAEYSLLTDVSPKILTLSPQVAANPASMKAINASVGLARSAAKAKTKNNDFRGMLYIILDADGVVSSVADVSNARIPKDEVKRLQYMEELKKKRAASISRPFNTSATFNPSILANETQLNEMYHDVDLMNADYMDLMDNCFNRSHYWARSNEIGVTGTNTKKEKQGGPLHPRAKPSLNSIHSEKVFVLFTRKYQIEFEHKWWYHTAPTVAVKDAETRFVMDRSYTDEPMTVEEWVYTFAGHASPDGKIKCKRIENLQEYYDANDTGYCFWIEGVNMYTYTPNDLMSPNSETQWGCDSLYSVTQGVPYPRLPYGPRAQDATELISSRGGEAMEYNDYVTTEENQKGWMFANKKQFIPDFCR